MIWNLQSSIDISDLSRLKSSCEDFSKQLKLDEIILLNGPLAAGKTEFVRQLVEILCQSVVVKSPSYALHHEYFFNSKKIDHWDLYRLQNEEELESVGFWDQLQNKNLIIIEWAERLKTEWLPNQRKYFKVDIELSQSQRILSIYQAA